MERRLTSCVAYALRVSYKMEVPSVTEHLKSALHGIRAGFSTHFHPDEAAAQRQIIRLYDALQNCKTRHFADESITEANNCTELECKAIAEGVLKTAQVQFEKLLAQTEMIIQDRDATIYRLEIDRNQFLIDEHRKHRIEMKQRRWKMAKVVSTADSKVREELQKEGGYFPTELNCGSRWRGALSEVTSSISNRAGSPTAEAIMRLPSGAGIWLEVAVWTGLLPEDLGAACMRLWKDCDLIRSDEHQQNQVYCPVDKAIPEVVRAMRVNVEETNQQKLFLVTLSAEDPEEMVARGKFVLETFGPFAPNCGFQLSGPPGSLSSLRAMRRAFPAQFLHYHAAGAVEVRGLHSRRSYSAFVHSKLARLLGASSALLEVDLKGRKRRDATHARSPELKDEVSKEVKKDPSNLTQVEAVCANHEALSGTVSGLYIRVGRYAAAIALLLRCNVGRLMGAPPEEAKAEAVKMCSELRAVLQKVFGEKRCDDWMKNSGRPKLRAFMKDDSLVVDDLSSLGPSDRRTACSKLELYDIAEKAFQEAVRAFHARCPGTPWYAGDSCKSNQARSWDTENKPAIGLVLYNYSDLLLQLGRFDEAEATCRKAMEHHDAGEEYAACLHVQLDEHPQGNLQRSCHLNVVLEYEDVIRGVHRDQKSQSRGNKGLQFRIFVNLVLDFGDGALMLQILRSSGRVKTMIRLRTKLAAKHSAAKVLQLPGPSYYVDSQLTGEEVQKGRSKKNKRKEKREEANPVTEAATESPPEEKPPPETAEAPEVPEVGVGIATGTFDEFGGDTDDRPAGGISTELDSVKGPVPMQKILGAPDGLCLACQAKDADIVSSASEAKECAKSVKKRKETWGSVLVPLAKFAGKVFGLPEKISGEPKSEASQVTPEQESTEALVIDAKKPGLLGGVPLPPPEAGVQDFHRFIGTQPATLDPEVLEHLYSREDHAEHYEVEWRWGETLQADQAATVASLPNPEVRQALCEMVGVLRGDDTRGVLFEQQWEGMKQTLPVISGDLHALHLPFLFEALGHSDILLTPTVSYAKKDPTPGARSFRAAEQAWRVWRDGGSNVSLPEFILDYARSALGFCSLLFRESHPPSFGAFEESTDYEEVDISQNLLTSRGLKTVATRRYMEEVHLSHNRLTAKGVKVIVQAAEQPMGLNLKVLIRW
ncbi:Ribulose bisphosphate carboxylase [Symbiodinium microadriaticum]|uniref:Ribulose bisphosphate carboxylase n=1 Tax=Symbiodinium microadriaticum TaxID=2951 RepID=A0A1Q9EKC4_SYMMI|nr:Ribulose bisphosphate carboxylase [Symbiodinium microadriaticum]